MTVSGGLNVGDQILVCDGVSLIDVTHDEAAQALHVRYGHGVSKAGGRLMGIGNLTSIVGWCNILKYAKCTMYQIIYIRH